MNKKSYLLIIIILAVLNGFSFYYNIIQKKGLSVEKEKYNRTITEINEKYHQVITDLKEYQKKYDILSQKILVLEKEKQNLIRETERLRSPEYMGAIIRDRISLKVEVKKLEEKIKVREEALATLFKEKEGLENLLGKEKHLTNQLTALIAGEKKKTFSAQQEVSRKASLVGTLEGKVGDMEKSQMLLKERIKGLEEIIGEKNAEIIALEKDLRAAHNQNKITENKLNQVKEEKALLEEELEETRQLYEEAKAKSRSFEDKLLKTSRLATELEEKLHKMDIALSDKALETRELEEKYKTITQKKMELEDETQDSSFKLELTKTINLSELESKAKILAASDRYNFVILNIGEQNGVKVGDKFSIYRINKKIGEISITRIRSNSSFGTITSLEEGITVTNSDTIR